MKYYLEPLKKYATLRGRARRKEYWQFFLFIFIGAFSLALLSALLPLFLLLFAIFYLGIIVPAFCVGIRRMHDVDKSGWFAFIPIYNLILACSEGTSGPNKYGPDPKKPEFDDFLSDPAQA